MIRKFRVFVQEVRIELGKVSWPSRPELVSSTWVVMISTALFALLIGVFDVICTTVIQRLIR